MVIERQDLSEREMEILRLVATGASNKEIAQQLCISTNTVKVHLRNIFMKIEVSSRTEAAMYAVNNRLVPDISTSETEKTVDARPSPIKKDEPADKRRLVLWILLGVLGAVLLSVIAYLLFVRPQKIEQVPSVLEPPTWQNLSPMYTPRSGFAVASLDGYIYAMGGESNQGITGAVERYDVERDRWKRIHSKPTPVGDIQAAVFGGKIYVPGGRMDDGKVTNVLEVFHPQENRWTQAAALPHEISAYALAVYEGKVYLFGGFDGQEYLKTVFTYDPDINIWQRMSDMSAPRAFASAVVSEGKIHLLGGFDGENALVAHEVYQPNLEDSQDSPWGPLTSLPQERYDMGATAVADVIYVIGGTGTKTHVTEALYYLPREESWESIPYSFDNNTQGLSAVAVGTKIYALGGEVDDKVKGDLFSYQVIYITVLPIVR